MPFERPYNAQCNTILTTGVVNIDRQDSTKAHATKRLAKIGNIRFRMMPPMIWLPPQTSMLHPGAPYMHTILCRSSSISATQQKSDVPQMQHYVNVDNQTPKMLGIPLKQKLRSRCKRQENQALTQCAESSPKETFCIHL